MKRLWILGASDPEMERIERLLVDEGEALTFAWADADGKRVHPGNAYRCDPDPEATHWVECAPRGGHPEGAVVIDHHRPGDPGYGRPPEEFWEASSIGQVYDLLGTAPWETPTDALLAAASDHCPAAAYRGLCPGVDPQVLMDWRISVRAKFQGIDPEALRDTVRRAMAHITRAPTAVLDGMGIADLRNRHVPEAPEASLRLGVPILCDGLPGPDGRRKVNILGDFHGDAVRAFLGGWAERHGIVDTYGDPARGFAGGYLK